MKSVSRRILPFCAVVVSVAAVTLTAAKPARAECRTNLYGMGHFLAAWTNRPWSYDSQAMDRMVEMGATSVWVDFPWAAMEATRGTINWSYADHQVDTAEAHGLEMFAYVGTTPDWAKLYPELPGHRTPAAEEFLPEFIDFHSALATRYAGRVKYYQFWNEPSGCSWINEGCANGHICDLFAIWQKRAYDALKAGNPDCVVSTGGGDPASYLQCLYTQLGGQTAFDAVSIHPYASGGPGGPGTDGQGINYTSVTDVRQVMLDHGEAHKNIWITEYGWDTENEVQKADDLIEVLTELKKPQYDYLFYVKYLVLNNWNDNDGDPNDGDFCCYGMTDEDFNPGAAFYAFKDFDKTFEDHVDFRADVTVGEPPLTVQFTETSCVNGATSLLWDFGDNQTSTAPNPSHTYSQDGLYTVRLTITGNNGTFFEEKTNYIRVGAVTEIVNPSYEEPLGFLTGWSSCLAGASSIKRNPGTHIPTPRFHDGQNSAGMSSERKGNELGAGAIWQEIPVKPEHTYRIQTWGFITAGFPGQPQYADDFMQLRIRDGDASPLDCSGNGTTIEAASELHTHLPGSPGGWQHLEGVITPAQNVITAIAYWKFSGDVYTANSLHLDDWSITDITPPCPADLTGDFDVDAEDLAIFESCATGPNLGPPSPGCEAGDLDTDDDIDQSDFGLFQRCFTGPDVVGAPDCMN